MTDAEQAYMRVVHFLRLLSETTFVDPMLSAAVKLGMKDVDKLLSELDRLRALTLTGVTTDPLFQWKTISKSFTINEADHYDDVVAKCMILNNQMEPELCGIRDGELWRAMCEAWKTVRNELASQLEMNKNQIEQIKKLEEKIEDLEHELNYMQERQED